MRALRKDAAALQVAVARLEADLGDARAAAHVEARERARVAREGEERLVADARAADRLQRVQQGAPLRHLADPGVGDAAARVQQEGAELRAAGGDGDDARVGDRLAAGDVQLGELARRLSHSGAPYAE